MPRATRGMARRTRASSGGSSHNGGGTPGMMGGRMGVRKSFFQQYFSSMRSATQGGMRMGVNRPIEKGQHPLSPSGVSARTPSTSERTFLMPRPFPAEIASRAPDPERDRNPGRLRPQGYNEFPLVMQRISERRARRL